MPNSKELFLSSQSFGFGPSAELVNIAKGLRKTSQFEDSQLTFYNTPELQAIFKLTQAGVKLTTEDTGNDVMEYLSVHKGKNQIDGIISSYDSAAIFYGWFHDIPTFFYDGMLSFWDVGKFKDEIDPTLYAFQKTKDEQDEAGMINLYRQISRDNHHKSIFLAYFLASRNFARGGDHPERQLEPFPTLQEKSKIVGGIVNPEIPADPSLNRDHVLVSMSASLVPTVTFEQSIEFARNTLSFATDTAQSTPNIPWIVAMNPKIYSDLLSSGQLSHLPSHVQVRESFSSEENLRSIRSANVMLISPGFSSIHEAAYYRTPVFFLPEQNGGQPVGYTKLKKEGYTSVPNLTFAENIGGKTTVDFEEFGMADLYQMTNRIFTAPEFEEVRANAKRAIHSVLNDSTSANEMGTRQHHSTAQIIGGFDGVGQITRGIGDFFNNFGQL